MQQVGIADAEVINRDADTRLLQFTNALLAESGIVMAIASVISSISALPCKPVTRQGLRQDSQQITLVKLQRERFTDTVQSLVALAVP